MDFLQTMARERLARVKDDERRISTLELRAQAEAMDPRADAFAPALRRPAGAPLRVIAEVKRQSPSAGMIRDAYDPVSIAASYEDAGASAISVLTEPDRFLGSIDDLAHVRERVKVPVLLKDFVVHERQIYEARVRGADAALLIVAMLSPGQLRDYAAVMKAIHLEPLVEILDDRDLDQALALDTQAIGVNNRDLRTLAMRRGWAEGLIREIPPNRVRVGESGYSKRAEIEALERAGGDAALVGESLLKDGDPANALRRLLGREETPR
ncbi:MAG TPA: indole-3-glycerol phosphate synthase TrpC [Candidatus Eisenbacteria bacterium]|nr:indole-3-glycerol phosphate synthase TrpC [Candidatus Eisenbacteria bacterium]